MNTIDDKDKIIDLLSRKREQEQNGGKKKGQTGTNQHRIHMINSMARKAIRENAIERLSAQETEFAELVVSGASLVEAYRQAFPELCYTIIQERQCKNKAHTNEGLCEAQCYQDRLVELLSYERTYARAAGLAKKPDIRSVIITRLEQEEGDVSHTASRLDNFIVKRLEAEAANPNNSAAARIAALKALSEHRAVAVAEGKAAERAAATSEEVMEGIRERVAQLTGGKREL